MQEQFTLKRLLRANVGIELAYRKIPVTVVDNYYGPCLHWEDSKVEDEVFALAWRQVQNPRYPHYVPESDRCRRFEDFDEENYEHRALKRHMFYKPEDELPNWLNRSEWRQLQKTFNRLRAKSPMNGEAWAEPYLLKLTPWCRLEYVAESVINALNEAFLPCTVQVHLTEQLVGERYTEVGIGHEDGHPLVWRPSSSWSDKADVILQSVLLREYEDGLQLRVGNDCYRIDSSEKLNRVLTRLPALIDRLWLRGVNQIKTGKYCMHSLRRSALRRNDDYDTEVFMSEGGSSPNSYSLEKTFVPTETDYMTLYEETEETLKEENNG